MNFEGIDNYNIFDFDDIASLDNITQLIQVWVSLNNLDGKDWENFRETLYEFCLKELGRSELGDTYSLGEFVLKIWGFYKGYLACRNYCRKTKQLKDSMP